MNVDAVHGSRLALGLCLSSFLFLTRPDATLGGQQRISLDLRDADLVVTIRMLAEVGGLNVVINEAVKGTVTVRVEDVSVDDALEVLFRTAGLAEIRKGSLIGILPRETLLKQQRDEAEARALPPVSFRTEIVKLQFANAMDLARTLTPFLSRWGKIAADKRTNSLIIRDTPNSSVFQLIESKAEAPEPGSAWRLDLRSRSHAKTPLGLTEASLSSVLRDFAMAAEISRRYGR